MRKDKSEKNQITDVPLYLTKLGKKSPTSKERKWRDELLFRLWYIVHMINKTANVAFKYCIAPNKEQKELFSKTFGCCRKVWNLMKADRDSVYQKSKETIHPTPAQYKKEFPFLKEVDSLALANVQLNQNRAYNEFFKSCKKKTGRRGFPKFKSAKKSKRSYTTNNQGGTVYVGDNFIRLPKVGNVKAIIHRMPKSDWKLKSATISQQSDGTYYCSILYEYDNNIKPVVLDKNNAIGLDYKSDGLYVDSNGNKPSLHKYIASHKRNWLNYNADCLVRLAPRKTK